VLAFQRRLLQLRHLRRQPCAPGLQLRRLGSQAGAVVPQVASLPRLRARPRLLFLQLPRLRKWNIVQQRVQRRQPCKKLWTLIPR